MSLAVYLHGLAWCTPTGHTLETCRGTVDRNVIRGAATMLAISGAVML